jgi:ATPase subunit of ABC transporter with duplicated ATPase domains
LLSRISERVLWIAGGEWGVVDGGYEAYERAERDRERGLAAAAAERSKASRQTPLKLRSQLETRIARAEREIAALDARKAEIDALFTQVELYEDGVRVKTLQAELESIRLRSAERVTEWETLVSDYEKT